MVFHKSKGGGGGEEDGGGAWQLLSLSLFAPLSMGEGEGESA